MTEEEREEFGEEGQGVGAPNLARRLIDAVRRRKGLAVEEKARFLRMRPASVLRGLSCAPSWLLPCRVSSWGHPDRPMSWDRCFSCGLWILEPHSWQKPTGLLGRQVVEAATKQRTRARKV